LTTHTLFRTFFLVLLLASGPVGCDAKSRDGPETKVAPDPTSTPAPAASAPAAPAPKSVTPSPAPPVALKVGDKLPDFTVKNTQNQDVAIASLYAKQPIVLTMYRGGWCPYCVTNLKEWQDKLKQVTKLGAQVVAVSPESPAHVAETMSKGKLDYNVLSDSTGNASKAMGLNFTLDADTQSKYNGYGINLPEHNADGSWDLPHPATYVVDTTGIIRYVYVNEDYKTRANPDEVIAAVGLIGAVPGK